jgi:integrase
MTNRQSKSSKTAGRTPNLRSTIYLGSDGWWHGRVTMGLKDDGSPDRRHRKGKTEPEVTIKVRKLESERDAGRIDKPGRAPTVAVWMAAYLDTICGRLVASGTMAPRTLDDYRSKTRLWIVPLLGQHRLDRLLADHLDRAYRKMFEAGLSSSTVLKVHRILSRALAIAVRRDLVARNVTKLVDPPAPNDVEIDPLTEDEARRVLKAAESWRNGARWSVALVLAIRQGEALGLRWSYLDLRTGRTRIWFQLQRSEYQHGCDDANQCGQKWHRAPCSNNCRKHQHARYCLEDCRKRAHRCPMKTCDPKKCTAHASQCPERRDGGTTFRPRKGRSKLTLQCPPQLLPILVAHRKAQAAERLAVGAAWQDHDLVFCRPDGRPIERADDWQDWKNLLAAAKVRAVRVHDGRHTAATLLIEQGVHIRTVQEILGHTRVTTTEKYTHVASPMVQDAAIRMGEALWGNEASHM